MRRELKDQQVELNVQQRNSPPSGVDVAVANCLAAQIAYHSVFALRLAVAPPLRRSEPSLEGVQ